MNTLRGILFGSLIFFQLPINSGIAFYLGIKSPYYNYGSREVSFTNDIQSINNSLNNSSPARENDSTENTEKSGAWDVHTASYRLRTKCISLCLNNGDNERGRLYINFLKHLNNPEESKNNFTNNYPGYLEEHMYIHKCKSCKLTDDGIRFSLFKYENGAFETARDKEPFLKNFIMRLVSFYSYFKYDPLFDQHIGGLLPINSASKN